MSIPARKRPARPQHDRRGKRELDPRRGRRTDHMQARHFGEHGDDQQRNRERSCHPQPAREIDQLGVGVSSSEGSSGSSAMPQIGHVPGPSWRTWGASDTSISPRASPSAQVSACPRHRRPGWRRTWSGTRRCKMIFGAGVFGMVRRRRRIDRHPAHRVNYRRCGVALLLAEQQPPDLAG